MFSAVAALRARLSMLTGSLQPVVKVWLHSTGEASPPAALLLLQILPVFSVVAPCRRGASPVSVRRQTFTTGCYLLGTPRRRYNPRPLALKPGTRPGVYEIIA